ncbi:MAG: hypothetical protein JXB14_00645 [Candidatus Altiarchaeota archaeon]|nr:hypothetical protein [Candidatus Altiarchaeota archaeon]
MAYATVTISKEKYKELQLFRELVENNLVEAVEPSEIELIEEALKEPSMGKAEFLEKTKNLL